MSGNKRPPENPPEKDEDDKESKEPDYNEHKQGEEEDGTGEMTISTTNEVF